VTGRRGFGPLVSGDWLAAHLDEVRVVDVRWYLDGRSGRAAYERGHLPGAVWLDIDADLSDPAAPAHGRHPLPSPERFAAALAREGMAAGQPVVGYDDAGGSVAARLWWLLNVLGEPVAVLDGGLDAWPGELSTDQLRWAPVPRAAVPWPAARFVDLAEIPDTVSGARGDTLVDARRTTLIDARSAARFAGGEPGIDPRPGHIPGAASLPWTGNLDQHGRFLPVDQLRARFAGLTSGRTIAYCGSGVTACHDLIALELAGVRDTALYPGSWSQWGADPARPAEVGS
jgi:thiosulfate/3-mercaptopyruvate sulfurtransferase